ncbi:right-handed parallel beta-helix repeat-containing protein [bacterium]|nr:right-handed parallel beta-helix repeat-containing protein [bacterium]
MFRWDVIRSTVIDGGRKGSVVTFRGDETNGRWQEGVAAWVYGFTIRNGSAINGGGINGNGAQVVIAQCDIHSNYAASAGGGIYGLSEDPSWIGHCKIHDNTAEVMGGGICNVQPHGLAEACLVYRNYAMFGGGVAMSGKLKRLTITGNVASLDGGGAHNSGYYYGCIVWGNEAKRRGADIYDNTNDLEFVASCVNVKSGVWGNYLALINLVASDPLFVDPMRGDFHLSPLSPVIDQQPILIAILDLDGRQVPIDGRADVGDEWPRQEDMGCYEFDPNAPTPTPTPAGPGDVRQDGRFDFLDLFELSLHWQGSDETSRKADINASGTVDAEDLLLLIELLTY